MSSDLPKTALIHTKDILKSEDKKDHVEKMQMNKYIKD